MSARAKVPPTYASTWEPRSLAALEERPRSAPDLGRLGLVYPGKRHVFSGPPESAKTIAAYIVALEVMRLGGTVLLIDFEMGPWDARDRLRELGASDEELERLLYVEPEEPATEEVVVELVERHQPALVVIDAAAGAFDLQGLDDNKRADVERFAGIYVRAFFVRGVATIVLDHVVKDSRSRGAFVIGSERKVGGADVHLGFEAIKPLHRGGRGLYRITTHKDRLGHIRRPTAAKLELVSDPDTHALSWALHEPDAGDGETFRPTLLMERVSRFLETQAEAVSVNTIVREVRGKREWVLAAVERLIEEGYAKSSDGPRGSRLIESLLPYRQDVEPLVPTGSPLVPGTGAVTGSRFPTPYRGEPVQEPLEEPLKNRDWFPESESDDIPF